MAGTTIPQASMWPHGGSRGRVVFTLGPYDHYVEGGDTADANIVSSFKAPYDFYVKEAWLSTAEDSFVEGDTNDAVAVMDDSSEVQTIVESRTLTGDDDAGTMIKLTVADQGPILKGAEVFMTYDSGDNTGEIRGLRIDLHCVPRYPGPM